jgi:hypothetical protein
LQANIFYIFTLFVVDFFVARELQAKVSRRRRLTTTTNRCTNTTTTTAAANGHHYRITAAASGFQAHMGK